MTEIQLPLGAFISTKALIETTKPLDIVEILCGAYASEWLAYYQYWTGSHAKDGLTKAILLEHGKDELKHAGWLFDAIIELGAKPPLDITMLVSTSPCKYLTPSIPNKIIAQNITSETCAIDTYQHIMDILETLDGHDKLYATIKKIQREEQEHKEELESIN